MTTNEITPESCREHASHMAAVKTGNGLIVQALIHEADRLEAVAARDTEAEELANVCWNKVRTMRPGSAPLDMTSLDMKGPLIAGVRAVLDHLGERGRLTPEGGTVLTAEEMAGVRVWAGFDSRLARFAPAEPAATAVKPIGHYRTMEADFATKHFDFPAYGNGRHTASDGGKWVWSEADHWWELREYGTAEPAHHHGGPFVEVVDGAQ